MKSNRYSLVAPEKVAKDPRKLAFFNPRMPVIRYKELTEEHHRLIGLKAVEDAVYKLGYILLPSSCVHQKRRNPDRRIMVYGRTYYLVEEDRLTELEWAKYRAVCGAEE